MGLSQIFKSLKTAEKFYLAILLSDSSVQAGLWKVGATGLEILIRSSLKTYRDLEEVATQTDKVLQELDKQSEGVNNVVFGLLPTWIDEQGVVAAKKPFLKKITEELDLKAVGFVITAEALARQLTADNARLSALLIEFSQDELYLSLIDQGKLISTKYVGRSDQVIADMTEALARLNAHLEEEIRLPSKMILASLELNTAELQELQQLLLNHDWVNSHPFLQPPTVDILAQNLILEAVIKQGGRWVTKKNKLAVVIPEKKEPLVKKPTLPSPQVTSFGVRVKMDQLPSQKKTIESDFVPPKPPLTQAAKKPMKIFSWFTHHRPFVIGGFVAGLVALGVLGLVWLRLTMRAEVLLDFATTAVTKEAQITLDPDQTTSDIEKLILATQVVETPISGSKTTTATGVKLVGEKATGKVKIYNKTTAEKTFDQGSKISKGNLVFTLNKSVKVASASVKKSSDGEGEDKKYGKAEVGVTATAIGADHNLSQDTELQVASFDPDTYSAVVTEAFSGGSSREVRVVSAADRQQLLADLRQELIEKATQTMRVELHEADYLVPIGRTKQEKPKFNAQIADEVSELSLDLDLIVEALVYRVDDLQPMAQKIFKNDIPEGYVLENNEAQILSPTEEMATQSGQVVVLMKINSQARPKLDIEALKHEILGKSVSTAEQILSVKDEIEAADIKIYPTLAAKLWSHLPKDAAKIKLE